MLCCRSGYEQRRGWGAELGLPICSNFYLWVFGVALVLISSDFYF